MIREVYENVIFGGTLQNTTIATFYCTHISGHDGNDVVRCDCAAFVINYDVFIYICPIGRVEYLAWIWIPGMQLSQALAV